MKTRRATLVAIGLIAVAGILLLGPRCKNGIPGQEEAVSPTSGFTIYVDTVYPDPQVTMSTGRVLAQYSGGSPAYSKSADGIRWMGDKTIDLPDTDAWNVYRGWCKFKIPGGVPHGSTVLACTLAFYETDYEGDSFPPGSNQVNLAGRPYVSVYLFNGETDPVTATPQQIYGAFDEAMTLVDSIPPISNNWVRRQVGDVTSGTANHYPVVGWRIHHVRNDTLINNDDPPHNYVKEYGNASGRSSGNRPMLIIVSQS